LHHSTERLLIDALEAGGVALIPPGNDPGAEAGAGVRLKTAG
jgi:hypothetical protein